MPFNTIFHHSVVAYFVWATLYFTVGVKHFCQTLMFRYSGACILYSLISSHPHEFDLAMSRNVPDKDRRNIESKISQLKHKVRVLKPKFHLARHVTSRHDSTRSTCRARWDERVERCCSNTADGEQGIVLACTSLVVFMLLHTQILFVPSNKIN